MFRLARRLTLIGVPGVLVLAACGSAVAPAASPAGSAASSPSVAAAKPSTASPVATSASTSAPAAAKPSASSSGTAASPSGSGQLIDISYGLSSTDSATLLPEHVAVDRGFFKAHGLNAQLVQIQGGPPTVAAIQSQSMPAGIVSTPLLFNAVAQGAPLIAVATEVQGFSMQVTVSNKVAKERNITPTTSVDQMLNDVKGLKVGGQMPGATTTVVFQGILKSSGKPADWASAGNTGTGDATLAALQNGVIDAMIGGSPTGELAETGGFGTVIWHSLSIDLFRTLAYGITIMNPQYAESHPQVAQGIIAAFDDAQKWILANPDEAATYAGTLFPTLPKDKLPAILKDQNFAPTSRMTTEGMKAAQTLANTYNLTNAQVSDDVLAKSWTDKYSK